MADPPIAIALLGRVVVMRGDAPVAGLADRERALLTVLALRDGPVTRDALCGLLWPDVPEARARLSLRVALSRLRAALPGRIAADRGGAALVTTGADDVDVRAVRPVLTALTEPGGGAAPETEAVRAAVARVRGPLADGLEHAGSGAFRAWLAVERAVWDQLVACAMAWLAGTSPAAAPALLPGPGRARQGEPGGEPRVDALAERLELLQAAARRSPLDEALSRELMAALGRAGRYDQALSEHDRLAAALDDALGLPPEPATEALRARILAAGRRPRRHGLPPVPPGPPPGPRAAELAAWLADPARRLVTVVGMPGTGRARLAREAAWRVEGAFLDGIVWVPRRAGDEPARLRDRAARALAHLDGTPPPGGEPAARLGPLERLLVLDGLDGDGEGAEASAEVAAWLEAAPGVRCLAVARAALGVYFEHRFSAGGERLAPRRD